MRIVIKDADFSDVSIGKVVEDLSFLFTAADGVDAINAFFPNYNSGGTIQDTTCYIGSEGGTVSPQTKHNRLVSDFHEVVEGMTVKTLFVISGGDTVPAIVAFDASKNVISTACMWINEYTQKTYIVPANVKYLKFQTNAVATTTPNYLTINASMPE